MFGGVGRSKTLDRNQIRKLKVKHPKYRKPYGQNWKGQTEYEDIVYFDDNKMYELR